MHRHFTATALTLAALLAASALLAATDDGGWSAERRAELGELVARRDFFTLRERLGAQEAVATEPAEVRLFRATLALALNRPQEADRILASLAAAAGLPSELGTRLERLRLSSALRLHRHDLATGAAEALVASPPEALGREERAEAANLLRLSRALTGVRPQETRLRGPSRLALGRDRRVPLTIGGKRHRLGLDTGANFSVIKRSAAVAAGLAVRPAGIEVTTSTGARVRADVAVAERVELGRALFHHVVFLVFPDELLTFADGRTVPGLIGFPLIEALGEVRFRRDNVLEVPIDPPRRTLGNLALDDLEPLVKIRYGKDDLVCRLDTGAAQTVFFEPFFRRYRERIEAAGRQELVQTGGVGGERRIPAFRLPRAVFTVAAAGVTLSRPPVYAQPIVPEHENFLFCNLGLDALLRFRAYVINFDDMALVVE